MEELEVESMVERLQTIGVNLNRGIMSEDELISTPRTPKDLGEPIYREGQIVRFYDEMRDKVIRGRVIVVDRNGCWEFPNDICYDVASIDGNLLLKHIKENDLSRDYGTESPF
jgi:hypothetical protein